MFVYKNWISSVLELYRAILELSCYVWYI